MLGAGENWDVWVDWYEDRVSGRQSLGEEFDVLVASLSPKFPPEAPKIVNTRIKDLIFENTPPEPIPAQAAGLHVIVNASGKIDVAPPADIDVEGNNVARIRQLLPLVRQAADDLSGHLNPNLHPELSRTVAQYRNALGTEGESVPWGPLFGLGVRLDNAAAAARRDIQRLQDPLEDSTKEALDSLLMLHGPLILATVEGRELMADADRNELTLEQQRDLARDAQAVAAGLKASPEIIEPEAASIVESATEVIGEGRHPERATIYGVAAIKNVATIAVPTGVLAAFSWWIGDFTGALVGVIGALPLGHSRRIRAALSALRLDYDEFIELQRDAAMVRLRQYAPFREFVIANQEPLRRIAENSPQLRWMLGYIDFIVETRGPAPG
jgi:hypothetical protein